MPEQRISQHVDSNPYVPAVIKSRLEDGNVPSVEVPTADGMAEEPALSIARAHIAVTSLVVLVGSILIKLASERSETVHDVLSTWWPILAVLFVIAVQSWQGQATRRAVYAPARVAELLGLAEEAVQADLIRRRKQLHRADHPLPTKETLDEIEGAGLTVPEYRKLDPEPRKVIIKDANAEITTEPVEHEQ